MAIIDTTNMLWDSESPEQQAAIMECLGRQPDLRQITDDDAWRPAISHLNMVIAEYAAIGASGFIGLYAILLPLKRRYDSGERTPELYDEIMQCE